MRLLGAIQATLLPDMHNLIQASTLMHVFMHLFIHFLVLLALHSELLSTYLPRHVSSPAVPLLE